MERPRVQELQAASDLLEGTMMSERAQEIAAIAMLIAAVCFGVSHCNADDRRSQRFSACMEKEAPSKCEP